MSSKSASAVLIAATRAIDELAKMRELKNAFARLDDELREACIRRVARVIRRALVAAVESDSTRSELLGDAWHEVFICQEGTDAVLDALEAVQEHLFVAADKLLTSTQLAETRDALCKTSKPHTPNQD